MCPAALDKLPDVGKLQLCCSDDGDSASTAGATAAYAAVGVESVPDKAIDTACAVKAEGVAPGGEGLQGKDLCHMVSILHTGKVWLMNRSLYISMLPELVKIKS